MFASTRKTRRDDHEVFKMSMFRAIEGLGDRRLRILRVGVRPCSLKPEEMSA